MRKAALYRGMIIKAACILQIGLQVSSLLHMQCHSTGSKTGWIQTLRHTFMVFHRLYMGYRYFLVTKMRYGDN